MDFPGRCQPIPMDSWSQWLPRLRMVRGLLFGGSLFFWIVSITSCTSRSDAVVGAAGRTAPSRHQEHAQIPPLSVAALQDLWKDPRAATQALIQQFSPREKLGQLMMLDFRVWSDSASEKPQPMTSLPPTVADLIHRYAIGSVILFRDNCQEIHQLHQLNRQLQESRWQLPLLIGIDQEGGIVQRLPMATSLPGNMALGATADPQWAQAAGELTGRELQALGFNVNFAPVVDVNVNQNNPVIGVRAFSSQPQWVASMAQAYITGLQQTGLLATAKHFPGHGNTGVDSHTGLPTIPYSFKQWQTFDCPPFQQAIRSDVAAIMSAHVAIPALDDTQVLSQQDGSKIIAGPLNFDYERYSTEALLPKASRGIGTLSLLIFQLFCSTAVQRVVFTKLSRQISPQLPDLTQALATVGSAVHKTLAQTIACQAVTLIKNRGGLPLDCRVQQRLLWIANSAASHAVVQQALQRINTQIAPATIELQTALVNWTASTLPPAIEQQLAMADKVVLMTSDLRAPSTVLQQLLDQAAHQKKPLIVLAANTPYDVAYCEDAKVDAMLAIYGYKSFDPTDPSPLKQLTTNLEAGIAPLFTDPQHPQLFNRPRGRLPVAIKAAVSDACSYPVGHGLRYP